MRACVAIPPTFDLYPFEPVITGLKAMGCTVVQPHQSLDADFLVNWSPWNGSRRQAIQKHFADHRKPVIVMENGWLPLIHGKRYYQAALNGWNGTGQFVACGAGRWESWEVGLKPWKRATDRPVVLVIGQRGHPSDDRTAALDWHLRLPILDVPPERVIRRPRETTRPLFQDMEAATEAHVWTSNAAAECIIHGVPVIQHGPNLMVSALATRPGQALYRGERTREFRRLAWAQWSAEEIATGEPFRGLLAMSAV